MIPIGRIIAFKQRLYDRFSRRPGECSARYDSTLRIPVLMSTSKFRTTPTYAKAR